MALWDHIEREKYPAIALEEQFTPEQTASLIALRERLRAGRAVEFVLDKRRLTFACWLVEHGRIGEGEGVTEGNP